jgi:hypothetical protein
MVDGWDWWMWVGLIVLAVILLASLYRLKSFPWSKPSYRDLLEQKNDLHESTIDWRYPDGTYVPQHKRDRMFRDLRKLSRELRAHPDNPDKSGKSE